MKIEMKYSFKAIKELLEITGATLETVGELAKDLKNIAIIAHVGNKHAGGSLTIEQIEDHLDKSDFSEVLNIAKEFGSQVSVYFSPNESSQAQ
jgi:hypothetical protein